MRPSSIFPAVHNSCCSKFHTMSSTRAPLLLLVAACTSKGCGRGQKHFTRQQRTLAVRNESSIPSQKPPLQQLQLPQTSLQLLPPGPPPTLLLLLLGCDRATPLASCVPRPCTWVPAPGAGAARRCRASALCCSARSALGLTPRNWCSTCCRACFSAVAAHGTAVSAPAAALGTAVSGPAAALRTAVSGPAAAVAGGPLPVASIPMQALSQAATPPWPAS